MADLLQAPFDAQQAATARQQPQESPADPTTLKSSAVDMYSDEKLLELWKEVKRETIDNQWVFHRQWQRNIWYILGRQWIEFQQKYGGWRDKRLASWIPRPVTNKCKEVVQTICAMFASITITTNIRANGAEPKNVATAAIADELTPILHEVHRMDTVMGEHDFWLCALGNAFLHTYVDYDIKYGTIDIPAEQCADCGKVVPSTELQGAQPVCPECGSTSFQPAMDEMGQPVSTKQPQGRPVTTALSPLELSIPNSYPTFEDVPYVVRGRWRTKRYYQSQPDLAPYVDKISWSKSPQDQSLALFTGLAQLNDMGVNSGFGLEGQSRGFQDEEGVSEYEVWMKPTMDYPDGCVFRVVANGEPLIIRCEKSESLPGPLPYTDTEGKPLFTFEHSVFEHVGGRVLGSGPIDAIIEKQNQLNQLDSHTLLCISRMSNPVWLEPKGAEVQKLTGMPGLVIKWNSLVGNGNAKPERIAGIPLDASMMEMRQQYLRDIEELAGTFDILKGMKPAGVEAFSALQLLVERSQARFASVFQSRGRTYKSWVRFALELEREFGPPERTAAILTPARRYTFKTYQRAQLEGSVTVVVEDGSTVPKTALGMRAAAEHAQQLGLLNPNDPDQQYELLKLVGLTRLNPSLDIHTQTALQLQESFEEWATPENIQQLTMIGQEQAAVYQQALGAYQQAATSQQLAMTTNTASMLPAPLQPPAPPPSLLDGTPFKWEPWYSAQVHLKEFVKWANGDHVRELIRTIPAVEQLLKLHMQEILMAEPQPVENQPLGQPAGQGGGMALANSNANSAPLPQGPHPAPQKVQMPPGKQSPQK